MELPEPLYYKLDKDHNVIPCDLMEWARFFQSPERIVKQEEVFGIKVSTVFLGIDHGWGWLEQEFPERYAPVVFETMIFDDVENNYMERCSTWDEALAMHSRAVEYIHRSHIDFP